jgi:hypothetical protein
MTKRKKSKELTQELQQEQRDRETILDERLNLQRLFPKDYSPDISVCADGVTVEVMFKLAIPQARNLAGLLKDHPL